MVASRARAAGTKVEVSVVAGAKVEVARASVMMGAVVTGAEARVLAERAAAPRVVAAEVAEMARLLRRFRWRFLRL